MEELLLSEADAESELASAAEDESVEAAEDSELLAALVAPSWVLGLQAASTRAAASAPRASLMFIDRYPEEKQRVVESRKERVFVVPRIPGKDRAAK